MRRGIACVLVAAACGLGAGGAAAEGGGINWVENLPPLDVAGDVQPGPVPNCRKPKMKCVRVTMKRMRELQATLGCDHRAVFATTYLTLTETYYELLREQPDFVEDRKYLFTEVAHFANYYFKTVHAHQRGEEVPPAWEIALDTAREKDVNGAQDMLLGINAHVQSDMPFVIAELGLETPDGKSRKPDHDVVNAVLEMAYQRVVDEVERRYDPFLAFTNPDGVPVDDAAGLELVRGWREGVWRNAERLTNAKSKAERRQVADSIEQHAAGWAQGIAAFETPGDRARRDAYCQTQLEAQPKG
ncbi:MAG TPA: DUF5995 family protein [Solirubrobacterales bacterium]